MQTESKIQQSAIIFYRNNYCLKHHKPMHCIFSVPNEGKSKKETIQKMAIGMLPGASDVILLRKNEIVFIEFKTPTGTQSDKQKRFQSTVESLGFKYHLIRSLKQFKTEICEL